jgi:hypothetical protein
MNLSEKLLFRGYRNNALWQSNEIKPNEGSDLLFTTPKAYHAYLFSCGQTTAGSDSIFEVYDVPDNINLYDINKDPEDLKYLYCNKGDCLPNFLKYDNPKRKPIIDYLLSLGYDGYKDWDSVTEQDPEDIGSPFMRTLSTAEEDVLFNPDKYQPIKTFSTVYNNGNWTEKQKEEFKKFDVNIPDYYDIEEDEDLAEWEQIQNEREYEKEYEDYLSNQVENNIKKKKEKLENDFLNNHTFDSKNPSDEEREKYFKEYEDYQEKLLQIEIDAWEEFEKKLELRRTPPVQPELFESKILSFWDILNAN